MTDFVQFKLPQMYAELVQGLLEAKRQARSLENSVDALLPLATNDATTKQLEEIRLSAARAGHVLQQLYARNAKDAFVASEGPNPKEGAAPQ